MRAVIRWATPRIAKIDVLRDLMGWDTTCYRGLRSRRAAGARRMYHACWKPRLGIAACVALLDQATTRWQKGISNLVRAYAPTVEACANWGSSILHYQLLIGGGLLGADQPVFWAALVWFCSARGGLAPVPRADLCGWCGLPLLGNLFSSTSICSVAASARMTTSWWALLTPIYWLMMSYSVGVLFQFSTIRSWGESAARVGQGRSE